MNKLDIERFIEGNKIHTIEIGFADINGVLRGKRLPARFFLKSYLEGTGMAKAPFAWDIQCGVYDDVELANFGNGFPDMLVKPVISTLRKIPWRDGSAFVFSETLYEDGSPLEVNPREILKNIIKRYNDRGYRPLVGSELEFYLLDSNKKPLFNGVQCYSLYRGAELEHVIGEMRNSLEELGINMEAFHIEYGPAQIEVIPEYGDALEMADNTVLIKNTIKEIARKHGLYATFMAKPWEQESGCGYHVHQSLWDMELKRNCFEIDETLAQNYLAGLIRNSRDFMVLGSPNINSYKRFRENSFAPVNVTWAHDNRTVSTRSLLGLGKGSRFEHRTGSADANPYLIIAASLAAGLYGIENKLKVPENDQNKQVLPNTLEKALEYFEHSEVAKEFFGEKFVKLYVTLGKHEVELYNTAVTDWEWARYLEIV
ncbi:MAG: glnA [Eubacterium sp.]|jgi:glutamine synthetase|nr:glnA [Eubacterium sp.]